MVARTNRNSPLPSGTPPRVQDGVTQRALDAIWTPLSAILKYLQPFVQQEVWKPLDYFGDWARTLSTLEEPGYLKNPLGRVELRGWATTAAGGVTVVGVLPQGYRPRLRISFPALYLRGGAPASCRLDVDIDGRIVMVSPVPAAGDNLSLNGVYFDTR